jgi:hypothetical protein
MSSNPSLDDCNQEANNVTYLWDDFRHHPLEESFVFIYQRTHEINAMLVCIETFVGYSKIILFCIKVSFLKFLLNSTHQTIYKKLTSSFLGVYGDLKFFIRETAIMILLICYTPQKSVYTTNINTYCTTLL